MIKNILNTINEKFNMRKVDANCKKVTSTLVPRRCLPNHKTVVDRY